MHVSLRISALRRRVLSTLLLVLKLRYCRHWKGPPMMVLRVWRPSRKPLVLVSTTAQIPAAIKMLRASKPGEEPVRTSQTWRRERFMVNTRTCHPLVMKLHD